MNTTQLIINIEESKIAPRMMFNRVAILILASFV